MNKSLSFLICSGIFQKATGECQILIWKWAHSCDSRLNYLCINVHVCSRHSAHLPYGTHHWVSSRQMMGKIADCSFFLCFYFVLASKVPLWSTLDNSCKVKGTIFSRRWLRLQAFFHLYIRQTRFLELTVDSPSKGLFLVCFILEFLSLRCTLSFSNFLIITTLGGGGLGGAGHSPGLRNNPLPCWPFPPRHFSQPSCWGKG